MFHEDDDDDCDRRGLVWSCPSSLMRLDVDDDADGGLVVDLWHEHAGFGLCKSGCGSVLPHLVHVQVLSSLRCEVFFAWALLDIVSVFMGLSTCVALPVVFCVLEVGLSWE